MVLLDTNVCISLMKGSSPRITERLFALHPSEVAISSITVFELEYGAAKSDRSEKMRRDLAIFLAPFTILPFDTDDAVIAGQLRGYLAKLGTPIGPYDIQIAAQGLARGLTVVTHNTGEFSRVPNLKLEDWTVPSEVKHAGQPAEDDGK